MPETAGFEHVLPKAREYINYLLICGETRQDKPRQTNGQGRMISIIKATIGRGVHDRYCPYNLEIEI